MNNRKPIQLNAELVKQARLKGKHTQDSLCAALMESGTKISRKTISSIENGNKTETFIANKIAEKLDVTLDYLMGKKEPTLHYWVQIYDEDINGKLIPINKLGTVFENSVDFLEFIDKQIYLCAPQYATELPNIVSSYFLDKTTDTIFLSSQFGESDNTERFKIEVKLIKLTDIGLNWATFTDFEYSWVEKSLKELLYKRSTFVNPTVSTEIIEYKYVIKITQLASRLEKLEMSKSLSKYDDSDDEIMSEKSKEVWDQLSSHFIKYEPIETNTFNELFRAVQLILKGYNSPKLAKVQCNFNSENKLQLDLEPDSKTRGLRMNIYRIETTKESTTIAPWPEYQMRQIENSLSNYRNEPNNHPINHVLSNETINEIKMYL